MSQDIAIQALSDESLRFLLNKLNMKLTSYRSFRHTILPHVMDLLYDTIEKRLQAAEFIHLSTDLWSNRNNIDFIALAACIINKDFEREILDINMMTMSGRHTAENISNCVEKLLNKYSFDKTKITGKLKILSESCSLFSKKF